MPDYYFPDKDSECGRYLSYKNDLGFSRGIAAGKMELLLATVFADVYHVAAAMWYLSHESFRVNLIGSPCMTRRSHILSNCSELSYRFKEKYSSGPVP